MLIQYIAPDPRAGRVVRLANELAEKTIAAERAKEITEEEFAEIEAGKMTPPDSVEEPSSTRKTARRGRGRRK